ncbi:hypothetical protein E1301_Tti005204 [Triplophysa tibetana]|uniref:Uncharacterized protein n=1 Tax=Triplophysa tibetana TaxID=1572043 RepID=A0A5A9PMR5_9TELE|nr:hypothetical protein E1301_Tti005204 [Triplophysa tibetana]
MCLMDITRSPAAPCQFTPIHENKKVDGSMSDMLLLFSLDNPNAHNTHVSHSSLPLRPQGLMDWKDPLPLPRQAIGWGAD